MNHASLLERQQINAVHRQLLQIGQTHLGRIITRQRNEAALRQTTLQRHLTTLKTDFGNPAGTGFLPLVATAGSLALTGTDTTANATFRVLGTLCRLNIIELHFYTSHLTR